MVITKSLSILSLVLDSQLQMALWVIADLLSCGCDLAASTDSQNLIDSLPLLTVTRCFDRDDDTGYTKFRADWELTDPYLSLAFHDCDLFKNRRKIPETNRGRDASGDRS